jgi:hypothetical protein
LILRAVTFDKGWDVYQDKENAKYPEPHWKRGCETKKALLQPCPYLYSKMPDAQGSAKNLLTVKEAIWDYQGTIPTDTPIVRALGNEGINIIPGGAIVDKIEKTITFRNGIAVKSFDAKVRFFNPFELRWQISFDGGIFYSDVETSVHPIYVCLNKPEDAPQPSHPNGLVAYRTVVHLACSNDGATSADEAVEKTWALFTGRNVKGWDKDKKDFTRKLHYYKEGTTFAQNAAPYTFNLLQHANDTGRCESWARLLRDACDLNGTTVDVIKAHAIVRSPEKYLSGLLVKNWDYPTLLRSSWIFTAPSRKNDMVPLPSPDADGKYIYGEFTNKNTLEGQNSKPPSQKLFSYHSFVRHQKSNSEIEYLDPSYGIKYLGTTENAAILDFMGKAIEMVCIKTLFSPSGITYKLVKPDPAIYTFKFTPTA